MAGHDGQSERVDEGFVVFWCCWSLVALLTLALSVGAHLTAHYPGDVAFERDLQALHAPLFGGFLSFESLLGSPPVAIAIIALLAVALLLLRLLHAAEIFIVTNALWGFDALIKWLVGRPRPTAALVRVREHASGASFPSGHVFSAVLLYGILIALVERLPLAWPLRRLMQAALLLLILGMGPARIYAGAHWPSDVLGAYLWAGLLLTLVVYETRPHRAVPWRRLRHVSVPEPSLP